MARKSRMKATNTYMINTLWKIGVYIRLSREDSRYGGESQSVTNQRKIIVEFIEKQFSSDPYTVSGFYIDDGHSGTSEDIRPAFQRLLADISQGQVNCVICKTLSRAFRNYADQGKFLEQYLPAHNCRFIAISNPFVDTYANPACIQNMEIPINGLMNDRFAAKTSEDVRRTFSIKRNQGDFIGAFAPYGYLKDPENKNALIIDEKAAGIIRLIFNRFLDGMSKNSIVHYLNDHGIPCPSVYKREYQGLNYQNPQTDPSKSPLWSAMTITNILKNRVYCGDMVQGRCRIKSYKVHIQEKVPEEEWVIVENTHEPIIERETFLTAQKLMQQDTRTAPGKTHPYLFSGFLLCADCHRAMCRSKARNAVYYHCRTYKSHSKSTCTRHGIRHDKLETAVLRAIQLQIYLTIDWENLTDSVNQASKCRPLLSNIEASIRHKERELSKITSYKQAVYQDWKDGAISHSDYCYLKESYEQQEQSLRQILKNLKQETEEEREISNRENLFFTDFCRHKTLHKLTRDIVASLVDHINIQENGNICIVFRFSDGLRERFPKESKNQGHIEHIMQR
ncbi:recombinase family protein [Lachnospiraceae bacterium 62-35]